MQTAFRLFVAALLVAFGFNIHALETESHEQPNSEEIGGENRPHLAGLIGDNVTIETFSSFGPPQYDILNFVHYATNAVWLIHSTGGLPFGTSSSITDARQILSVTSDDFITSRNSTAPRNGGFGGTVWQWYRVKAKPGFKTSLAQAVTTASSFDPQNSLAETINQAGKDYTKMAVGFNANGTMITAGSSSQEVDELIFAVGFKSYVVSSAADVLEVRNFVRSFTPWGVTMQINVGGSSSSKTLTTSPVVVTEKPVLKIYLAGGKTILTAVDNGNKNTYKLQSALTSNGPYVDYQDIKAGESITVSSAGRDFFVRYKP